MAGSVSRRRFLQVGGALAATAATVHVGESLALTYFSNAVNVPNPLLAYPDRGWERVYRDQYRYDSSFPFICAPNDTHQCRTDAFMRNGVVLRTEQSYEAADYQDQTGNVSGPHWNPRGCGKGYTVHHRVYGPYRAKWPAVRAGWKEWADAGFPSLSDEPGLRSKYRFDDRASDDWVRLSWDEAFDYTARGLTAVAETYSGDEGRRRLVDADGYPEEMLEHWEESGVRTMKYGSSLPIHGVAGKFSLFRFANSLALLDAKVRGVGADEAKGASEWSEYTWRGDQAPGFPFVHGLQASEVDFNDLRNSKLLIMVGKNLVENKLSESHFMHEVVEQGGKLVTIVPEYSPPATKSDYWIPVRAGLSDTALMLGIAKAIIDRGAYDSAFLERFTDMPLLVRLDTLERVRANDVFAGYTNTLGPASPSFTMQAMTPEQYAVLGDRVAIDAATGTPRALNRDEVGAKLSWTPLLDYRGEITLADGSRVEVATALTLYREHLRDYDLETVCDITGAPRDLVEQLITDLATIKPAAFHVGEGVNHYFHATLHNRATYLIQMLLGNVGKPGSGVSTWAGNYKGGVFHGSPWQGPGVGGFVNEDPFNPMLDPEAKYTAKTSHHYIHGEETSYWGFGDTPLIVDTPDEGRKVFTGKTHMPRPTKVLWYNNANLLNQAKWHYHLVRDVNPKIDMIVDQQIEWTGSAENADLVLPVNSWLEFQTLEMTASCSNPFVQIWKGGIPPLHDTIDDLEVFTGVARRLGELHDEDRFQKIFAFHDRPEVYLDRVLAASFTTAGYTTADLMAGKYGVVGGAMMLYGSYPRIPFKEQVEQSLPFYTDTGRMHGYVDIPEAIEYGENLIVHREAVEATPYMPNVIVSTSPFLRPQSYGIPNDSDDPDHRAVRNVMMSWAEVKKTKNPLIERGYEFFCLTPKSRHSVHSSWAITDWHWVYSSNFGDPYRVDKRMPGIGDAQMHMNPDDAKALGIDDGDYVWIDANSDDRPYVGAKDDPSYLEVSRLLCRLTYNKSYPRGVTMLKHAFYMSTPKTVRASKERPDGRALADTGYQSSFRSGSQQSITRGWAPPMHQTDSLFHKKAAQMGYVFGFDVDNHAINTVPKETMVRVTRAEAGGLDGQPWSPGTSGRTPGNESPAMDKYLAGGYVRTGGQ